MVRTSGALFLPKKKTLEWADVYLFLYLRNAFEGLKESRVVKHLVKGISITSIQMSKGLEFDEVIIPDVREDIYQTKYDRSLLYVACTRAMHRLTWLYTETPSPFIPKSIKEA